MFFCGPPALSKQLKLMSNKYTSPKGTMFHFGKGELFGWIPLDATRDTDQQNYHQRTSDLGCTFVLLALSVHPIILTRRCVAFEAVPGT